MELEDTKARVHIELSKDPITIDEAVQKVIAYIEATCYPKPEDTYYNGRNKRVRQVKRNTTKEPRQTDKTGKLKRQDTNYETRQNFGKNYSVNIDRNNRTPKARMGTINFRNKGTLCSAIIAPSQVIFHEVVTVTHIYNPIAIGLLTDSQTDNLKDMSLDRHKSPCPRYGKKIVQYINPMQMFVLLLAPAVVLVLPQVLA